MLLYKRNGADKYTYMFMMGIDHTNIYFCKRKYILFNNNVLHKVLLIVNVNKRTNQFTYQSLPTNQSLFDIWSPSNITK